MLSTPNDPETRLRALHDQFCKLTGKQYCYDQWRYDWAEFAKYYTADDLVLVFEYVKRINYKRERRYQIVTTLAKILDLRNFDGLKADAEVEAKSIAARKRAWQPSAGQIALAEMRKEEIQPPDKPATPISIELVAKSLLEGKHNEH